MDVANGVVSPQVALVAGNYGITVTAIAPAASPNDFLGTATIVVNLEVTDQQLVADADSIPQGERAVATVVAPGYAGEVASFRAVVNNVNLETPSTTPPGLVFPTGEVFPGGPQSDPNSRAIVVSLAAGIQPGETRIQTFEVTAKETGHADTPIELMVSVYAIALPPHAEFETDTGSAIAAADGIQFTPPVGHPGAFTGDVIVYENGVGDPSHPIAVSRDGEVTTPNALGAADAGEVVVLADYRADATNPTFLGTLTLTMTVKIFHAPQADEVIATRQANVYAGPTYAGAVFDVAADDSSVFRITRTDTTNPAGFTFDNNALQLRLDGALGEAAKTAAFTVQGECIQGGGLICRSAVDVPMTVIVTPLRDPGQTDVSAVTGSQDVRSNLVFPAEGGANVASGRQVDVVGLDTTASPAEIRQGDFVASNAGVLRYIGGGIPRGTHRVAVRVRRSSFLGDLMMTVEIVAGAANLLPISDLNLALPPEARAINVNAAQGYADVVHTITSHAPDVTLVFAPFANGGLAMDANGVVKVGDPLSGDALGSFPVEARKGDFAPRVRPVAVNVFQVPSISLSYNLVARVDADGELVSLAVPLYADAVMRAHGTAAGLGLFGDRIRATDPLGLTEGYHAITVLASEPSGAFLGDVEIVAEFNVAPAPPAVPAGASIPQSGREVNQTVAFGYEGWVAGFAARNNAVVLETPADPPFGFDIDRSRQFIGSNGFGVSITLVAAQRQDADGEF